MATRILPEHGFDPSCGDFGVSVVQKRAEFADSAAIRVKYDEWIDLRHTAYSAELPWGGGEVSVADVEWLLDSARVPAFIRDVCAVGMILRCVDGALAEIKNGDAMRCVPSISVKINSDKETFDFGDFVFEDDD